ncbi:MAG: KH domain-containing protein [Candidatus Aenigmarchaeota archaeon]|nr:KH domain-containing protein [Candidatus Aenigmarchaeota archaeon]MDI6722281.1 KH domain-containing protein [Candidatus Aenigmarchaeota archaeon]
MIRAVRIPEERLPVVIGKNGSTKNDIQKLTHTKISIGEEITIEGDSLDVLTAENIIKAIGRGFQPNAAFLLKDEGNAMEILNLPKERKELNRIRSRLIGTRGKCRKNIESLTRTHISIYGRTVSVIGKYENIRLVAEAIKKLIEGAPHSFVYKFLEERQE